MGWVGGGAGQQGGAGGTTAGAGGAWGGLWAKWGQWGVRVEKVPRRWKFLYTGFVGDECRG